MNVRPLALLGVLLAAALAGCLGSEADPEPQSTDAPSESPSESPAPPGSSAPPPPPKEAPVAVIEASGANVTFVDDENGTRYEVPLGSTVLLDASNSSDPEGGELSFVWTLSDGNVSANESLEHVFAARGSFFANLTVTSAASSLTGQDSVLIVVLAPVPKEIVFTGSLTGVYNPATGDYSEEAEHVFAVDAGWTNITASIEFGDTSLDLDYALVKPDGKVSVSAAAYDTPVEVPVLETDPGEPDLYVPEDDLAVLGAWKVRVSPGVAVEGDYTVTLRFR